MHRLILLLGLFLALTAAACAHDPNLSSITIDLDAGKSKVTVVVRQEKIGADPDTAVRLRMPLWIDGKRFEPSTATVKTDEDMREVTWTAPLATQPVSLEVRGKIFPEDGSSRTVVSVFRGGDLLRGGVHDANQILTYGKTSPPGTGSVITEFVRQGIEHIFLGFDHICFVIGLLLLGGSAWRILKTVTAFTLAHSITLSVAATGLWTPSPRIIEPLIALSIVAIAAENIWNLRKAPETRNLNWRPWLAFGFGLIHGFGFAGALQEVGLPQGALGWALGSFNVGVEIGQATIVLIAAPLLALLAAKIPKLDRPVIAWGSAAIGLLGAFWFVERVVG